MCLCSDSFFFCTLCGLRLAGAVAEILPHLRVKVQLHQQQWS
jgi:hypothetical protein